MHPTPTIAKETSAKPAITPAAGFSYLPFLDGLRAISILLVMGFHQLGPITYFFGDQFSGWAGVDLFFIISGFLISSILLKEQDRDGTFSMKNFYVRRWLRICPAYYVFLTAMFVFMLSQGRHEYSAFAVAGLYLSNIDLAFGWGLMPPITGLAHTWSLSVEEQFYLLWPAAMKISKGKAFALCVSLIVLVYFWRLFLITQGCSWMRISSGLDTKLDSLMFGVLAAMLWRKPNVSSYLKNLFSQNGTQALVALAVLVSLHFLGHPSVDEKEAQLFFWGIKMPLTLISMTTLLLSLVSNTNTRLVKFLSTKPMVFIGRLSYSLYLWHIIVNFPQFHNFYGHVFHNKKYVVEFAKYATCFSLAAFSYYCVEQPFLKLKSKFS